MGRRGPKPKTLDFQLLHGYKPSRINRHAPTFTLADGEPPDNLSDEGRDVWEEVAPDLVARRVLSVVDVPQLVVYCEAVATHRQATADVREHGLTVRGSKGGTVKNPAATIQKEAAVIMRSYAAEFGLTPTARQNVIAPPEQTEADEFF